MTDGLQPEMPWYALRHHLHQTVVQFIEQLQ
jgi:hypothetical protein